MTRKDYCTSISNEYNQDNFSSNQNKKYLDEKFFHLFCWYSLIVNLYVNTFGL